VQRRWTNSIKKTGAKQMKTEIYTIEQTETNRILKRNGERIAKAYLPEDDMFETVYLYPADNNLSPAELWQKLLDVSTDCWQKVKRDRYLTQTQKDLLKIQAIYETATFYRFCFGKDLSYDYLQTLID
jgi:hypothetical protein